MAKSLIDIWDSNGQFVDRLSLNEPVTHVNDRVCIGTDTGLYYKGVGIQYKSHFVLKPTLDYDVIEDTNVSYLGFRVSKKCFEGLNGIIQEKYQPHFPDFIGACGAKELSIIENEQDFKLSSTEVKKIVNWDKENHHYYIALNYKCGRRKYFDGGDPLALKGLLQYMIETDWNFVWDKNCISDISYNGLVTDVADMFKSSDLKHKIGTVYSVLYSLYTIPDKFKEFISFLGYEHRNQMDFIFNSVRFLHDNGVDVSSVLNVGNLKETYQNIVLNYLIVGKNCAHCSYVNLGDEVANEYVVKVKNVFGVN